jgi:signal transduction histidine kinase
MSNLGDSGPASDIYPPGYVGKLVHELRTPLTALRGSLGLLASVIDDASSEVKSFASIAERNAARLASMLDDLAELERIRGGSVAVRIEAVDLADLVEAVVAADEELARQAGITVQVNLEIAEAATDPAVLKGILGRLLRYALRMSSPGSLVRVRATRDGGATRFEVTDHGKPVDASSREEMFDPFSVVARRGQDASARPGLGLPIARALAGLLSATLTFTSTPDGGVFGLTIP